MPDDDGRAIISLFGVHKRYGAKGALSDVSFEVARRELLFITGPSGAGKTTLLKLLYLAEPVSDGQILVDGMNLSRLSRRRIPHLRRKLGIIFQDYKLIPSKTVFNNVALVVEAAGGRGRWVRKKVAGLLRTVGMEDKGRAFPPSLSGGEQQRVAVARAIATDPEIILADEPTGSLDAESAGIIFDLLQALNARGATVMVATHDTALIRKTGGRVIILNDGRVETTTVIPRLPA